MLSPVVQAMYFVWIGKTSGRLVDDERIVGPGVPVAVHDLHELVGAIVARIVRDGLLQPHVLRLDVVHRGDDVPGGAAARHQVERLEQPRDMERVVVGGRVGGTEAEVRGAHGHRHEAGDRIHLDAANAVRDGLRETSTVKLRHAEAVIEEGELEFPCLQHPADVCVVIG